MYRSTAFSVLLFAALLLPGALLEEARADEPTPETVTVRRGPLGATVDVKGVCVPVRMQSVTCRPKAFAGALEVIEAAVEGPVVEGQTLVQFKTEELDKQIAAAVVAAKLARVGLERSERSTELKKVERALSMEEAVRNKRLADQRFDRFVEVERKLREKEAVFRIEGSKIRLKNQQEELAQLEKMYAADDLTEETEEIVLRRAKRSYERSLKGFEFQKQRHEWFMKETLPREFEGLRLAAAKSTAKLERLRVTQPLDIDKEKLELTRARTGLQQKDETVRKLEHDLDALTVKAPMAGYAVPGTFGGGKWSALTSMAKAVHPGKRVKAGTVLFTVVDPASLVIEASVAEAELAQVKKGLPATITTALTGKTELAAVVDHVARYGAAGAYAVRLRLREKNERLRTGVACEVKITKASPEEVLSLPKSCFFVDGETQYVFLVGEDGPMKTEVKVGRSAGGRTEIKEGVKAGQAVLKTPPEKE